jgi:xylan 1,4-beta-xylosidase
MPMPNFECDFNDQSVSLERFFEHCVGSGHATLALRADWQKDIRRCSEELGFRYVRFHGILSDDMGTVVNEMDKLVYSFFNADQVFDFLTSIGMRPFVELSFMPSCLSSGDQAVFHYKANVTPPRDYSTWAYFIQLLVQHWVDRYGIEEASEWFFEVWNEPNLPDFWTGSQADYFKFYQYTADAIKKVDPNLRVGGPATANNAWIEPFLAYNKANKVPVDFVSTHHYPTDAFGQPGDDTVTQLSKSSRSVLRAQTIGARKESQGLPLYYTEWATSSNPFDQLHDSPYAAAFIVKTIMEARGLVNGYSYWAFSDIFEENYFCSLPFHGGFGLLNIYGIPKPAYRAYQLLHRLGNEIMAVKGEHETVDAWVVRKDGCIQILVTNWALPLHNIQEESITIKITNPPKITAAFIERIDDAHCNTRKAWEEMGSPASLSKIQVAVLEKTSEIVQQQTAFYAEKEGLTIPVTMPPQSVACITLIE